MDLKERLDRVGRLDEVDRIAVESDVDQLVARDGTLLGLVRSVDLCPVEPFEPLLDHVIGAIGEGGDRPVILFALDDDSLCGIKEGKRSAALRCA